MYRSGPRVNRRFTMKYTKEERLDIGRRIYGGRVEPLSGSGSIWYQRPDARDYMGQYRDANQLPAKRGAKGFSESSIFTGCSDLDRGTQVYDERTAYSGACQGKDRRGTVKKGYEVKGDGAVIVYDRKNTISDSLHTGTAGSTPGSVWTLAWSPQTLTHINAAKRQEL